MCQFENFKSGQRTEDSGQVFRGVKNDILERYSSEAFTEKD